MINQLVAFDKRLVRNLDSDLREHYEERAAIYEYDASIGRAMAEIKALSDALELQERRK